MAIIDPATDAALEVRDLVSKARHSIQGLESEKSLRQPSMSRAVYYLATAIDKLVNETLVPDFKQEDPLDVYKPGRLDELYMSIVESSERSIPSDQKMFVISFPDAELSIDEIWPDGNAPDDPTPEDVIEVMKMTGVPSQVAGDWLLIEQLYVRPSDDENGILEVEWNGG